MLRQYKMNCIVMGATMIFVLLAISFVGIVPSETLAQTTNTTTAGCRLMLQVQAEAERLR